MAEFHFLRPLWLFALLPLALLVWLLSRRRQSRGDWESLCDVALLSHLLVKDRLGKPAGLALSLYGLGGVLALIALAGPVWERIPAPVFRNDSALVIALDLSRSMDAADIKPSRLERARYKIADILKQRKDGLTALLVYSGDAFVVTPLTDDVETINAQLSALTSDLMPAQGSRADLALELAQRLLTQSGLTRGDVLLITSGVGLSKAEPAAQRLAANGYRVSVLGAGGVDGAPIPLPEGGFLQDSRGNIVISKLAAPALQQLARQGRGRYHSLSVDNADLSLLVPFFAEPSKAEGAGAAAQVRIDLWQERGPWLLLLLLPIAALAFRRGYLGAVVFLCVLPLPERAHALDWQDLWHTPDQQASQALASGDAATAAEKFLRPDWRAAAQYQAGQFEDAAKTLAGSQDPGAHYNRGNALARLGRYQEAIDAYERALSGQPDDEDARYNKELVEKALKAQQDQEKQEQDQQKQDQGKQGGEGQDQSQQGQSSQAKQDGSSEPKSQGQPSAEDAQGQAGQENGERSEQKGKAENGEASSPDSKPAEGEQDSAQAGKGQPDAPDASEKAGDLEARPSEQQQASEQWLRRIPDDPGGLLKRKFYYQYQQRQGQSRGRQP